MAFIVTQQRSVEALSQSFLFLFLSIFFVLFCFRQGFWKCCHVTRLWSWKPGRCCEKRSFPFRASDDTNVFPPGRLVFATRSRPLFCDRAISALTKGPTASLSSAVLFRLFQDLPAAPGAAPRILSPALPPPSPSTLTCRSLRPSPGQQILALSAERLLFSPDARPPSSPGDALSPALDLVPMAKNISNHIIAGSVCVRACVCPTFSLSKLGQARSSLGDYRTV